MEGTESEEDARRASHNVLERKRRNDLKNSFDILRMGIPDLEENVRAPKVVILRKAVEYIKSLQTTDKKYDNEILKEQKRFNRLKDRLSQLRSSFPATL
jgi:Myc proto-oncogene protein